MKNNIIGFVISIILTLAAYVLVFIHVHAAHELISHAVLIPAILLLAVVQLMVQLVFFVHLGSGGAGWKWGIFISTLGLVLLIVVGSIWIMDHLNYNMTPAQVDQYLQQGQGGF